MKKSFTETLLDLNERFFTTWRFPSYMLMTLGLTWVLIMVMAWMPVTDTAWGAFAEDFKVWCFGYDPATGGMESIYLIMYTVNPLILSVVIWFVWLEPMRELLVRPAMAGMVASAAFITVLLLGLSFVWMYEFPEDEEFEFRADILRTSYSTPEVSLIDENENVVRLEDYDGKVVILTSVYASCGETCPMILDQAKRVMDSLSAQDREDVVLMAITMHPEKDTPYLLKRVAEFYRLDRYRSHLLTGEPDRVHRLLDELGVARKVNEETGEIDHVNLFLLIDREGTIAFRFTIGERQEDWMRQALQLLVDEAEPVRVTQRYE